MGVIGGTAVPWESQAAPMASSGATVLRTPMWMAVGILAVIVACVAMHALRRGKKGRYEGGIKAANTKYAKALPEYVSRRRKWRIAMLLLEACAVAGMVSSAALLARPSQVLTEEGDAKKRDIFLCLDISYSIFSQNEQLVDSLKGLVRGLSGERFGITIFNSSSVMYVPMTDDYGYVMDQLDVLNDYFKMQAVMFQEEYAAYGEDITGLPPLDPDVHQRYLDDPVAFEAEMSEVEAGVTAGVERGSSIIGEGLATCLYSFPHLEDESRTRVIILSTDNDPAALSEDVSLRGAGELCAKHDVTVYGIFPSEEDLPGGHSSDYGKAQREFDSVCSGADGKLYVTGHGEMDVAEAVSDIRSKEAITIKEPAKRYQVDVPTVPYAVLLASVVPLFVTVGVLRPW